MREYLTLHRGVFPSYLTIESGRKTDIRTILCTNGYPSYFVYTRIYPSYFVYKRISKLFCVQLPSIKSNKYILFLFLLWFRNIIRKAFFGFRHGFLLHHYFSSQSHQSSMKWMFVFLKVQDDHGRHLCRISMWCVHTGIYLPIFMKCVSVDITFLYGVW